ncbi:hypothetical protein Huta_1907 [Halorhabdus utahensis DSM 12940]|uniref:Uncharacterized protein n=1 Tax=Halorhabdus utahensis (strain DSM 12940 / JCM 11049 / AX-2) TaxID=519442 RepID=C7NT01_HALUD|nr:hypothetical protein [Halorhabdus utahensis]ACV12076.1 hypothetical protein Huta_1907 [Halorhabdus utahensis DSM 12940]
MELIDIHRRVKASNYKPWQIYFLGISVLAAVSLYFDIGLIHSFLRNIESYLSPLDWMVILGIQGVLIGFVAEFFYEQGDGYAKVVNDLFGSKDQTLLFRVGIMTVVSGIITMVVPTVLRAVTEFLIIQTTGAVILLGIVLIHVEIRDWNAKTEWPAIVAGGLLAIVPSLVI